MASFNHCWQHLILSQYLRAVLCTIPILAGLLLIVVWTKVYQQYFFIRSLKRLRKMELAQQFYNHQTLLALNKPVPVTKMVEEYQEPVYEVYHPQDVPPAPGPMPVPVPDPSLAVCSHVYVNEVLSIKCVLCSQPYFRNVVCFPSIGSFV